MSTKFLDPNLYSVVVAGIPLPPNGYAEGSHIKLARDTPAFIDVVGVDGTVTRVRSHDDRATFTLSLMQTSETNAILAALHAVDLGSDNGAGVGPFVLKDRNGLTAHDAAECWISQTPDNEQDKTATSRDWVIRIAKLNSFEGGN